ncbi:MAG TPA: DUF4956 domain-containing protein [Leucothrix sp.]|nr:DUF4956 domain-containing protein [Leucothrix sp.]
MLDAITLQNASESTNIATLVYTILLAFILSSMLGIVYQKTFRGAFFSRNYVQSVVLISIIAAVIIQAIGDSVARGLGIMAAMGIVRFRNNLKDPRDLLFLFASLAAGIACGTYAFSIAIIGTLGFILAVIVLYFSPLGLKNDFDGMLSFSLLSGAKDQKILTQFLDKYCQRASLMILKDGTEEESLSYTYHIRLQPGISYEAFMTQLKRFPSIQGIQLKMVGAGLK